MSWSTTVYAPVEGGHRHIQSIPEAPMSDCTVCGGRSWDEQHKLTEQYIPDAVDGPGLFCIEASDDNGKSYAPNGLRWVDVEDAKLWAAGLSFRWLGCTNIRVRACDDAGQPTGDTVYQTL